MKKKMKQIVSKIRVAGIFVFAAFLMLAVCDCFALRFVDRMPFRLVRRIDCGIDSLLHSRFVLQAAIYLWTARSTPPTLP